MAVSYFASGVELGTLNGSAKALSWAQAKGLPLLAIAASAGGVALVNEEGKHVEGKSDSKLAIQSKRCVSKRAAPLHACLAFYF